MFFRCWGLLNCFYCIIAFWILITQKVVFYCRICSSWEMRYCNLCVQDSVFVLMKRFIMENASPNKWWKPGLGGEICSICILQKLKSLRKQSSRHGYTQKMAQFPMIFFSIACIKDNLYRLLALASRLINSSCFIFVFSSPNRNPTRTLDFPSKF